MKERLLDYLACPSCGGEVRLASVAKSEDVGGWTEIVEGELACAGCGRAFAVERGVPRFAALGAVEREKAETAANFGWQWRHFTHEDERYAEQFLGWIAPVPPEFFRGKLVLEGGGFLGGEALVEVGLPPENIQPRGEELSGFQRRDQRVFVHQ